MKNNQQLLDLLKRALVELQEHNAEYHHRTDPALIEEIQTTIKDAE